MKKVLLILFFVTSLSLFFVPKSYAATCPDGTVSTDLGCIHTQDPGLFVADIYNIGIALIGFVAVLFIIIGAYYIMTSRGNYEQLQKGKSFIYYALAGIVLAVLGFVFIEIITGQILKIPGFGT